MTGEEVRRLVRDSPDAEVLWELDGPANRAQPGTATVVESVAAIEVRGRGGVPEIRLVVTWSSGGAEVFRPTPRHRGEAYPQGPPAHRQADWLAPSTEDPCPHGNHPGRSHAACRECEMEARSRAAIPCPSCMLAGPCLHGRPHPDFRSDP